MMGLDAKSFRRRIRRWRLREREAFFKRAAAYSPLLAVEADGMLFVVSTGDSNIGRGLFVKRSRKEFERLRRALVAIEQATGTRPGGTLLDIGANIGTTSLPAVLVHGFDRVLALEPSPQNFRVLQMNVRANGCDGRVVVLPVAASNRVARVQLEVSSSNSGAHHIVEGRETGLAVIEVETTTLDLLAEQGCFDVASTALAWMDVEGHEGLVLEGAKASILDHGTPVVVELARGHDVDDVPKLERTMALLERHYTHFLDLGRQWTGKPPLERDLRRLAHEHVDGFTDVLALRLETER